MKIQQLANYKQAILDYCIMQKEIEVEQDMLGALSADESLDRHLSEQPGGIDVIPAHDEQVEEHNKRIEKLDDMYGVKNVFKNSSREEIPILQYALDEIEKVYSKSKKFELDFLEDLCSDKRYGDLEITEENIDLLCKDGVKYNKTKKQSLANQVSIMDYVHKENKEEAEQLEIVSENDSTAIIKDPLSDGEIIVDKETNTWSVSEKDGLTKGGTVQFVERTLKLEKGDEFALLKLTELGVEEYLSSKEYNEAFVKEQGLEKEVEQREENEHPETTLANQVSIMDYKEDILKQTVGKQFGEEMLENIREYLPEPKIVMPEQQLMQVMQEEIIEYIEDFEMEQ